jgi:hypothetical protein
MHNAPVLPEPGFYWIEWARFDGPVVIVAECLGDEWLTTYEATRPVGSGDIKILSGRLSEPPAQVMVSDACSCVDVKDAILLVQSLYDGHRWNAWADRWKASEFGAGDLTPVLAACAAAEGDSNRVGSPLALAAIEVAKAAFCACVPYPDWSRVALRLASVTSALEAYGTYGCADCGDSNRCADCPKRLRC